MFINRLVTTKLSLRVVATASNVEAATCLGYMKNRRAPPENRVNARRPTATVIYGQTGRGFNLLSLYGISATSSCSIPFGSLPVPLQEGQTSGKLELDLATTPCPLICLDCRGLMEGTPASNILVPL